jgi:hypothetical protein
MLVSDKVGMTVIHRSQVKLHAVKRCSHALASSVAPTGSFPDERIAGAAAASVCHQCQSCAPRIGRCAAGTPITLRTDWSPEQAVAVFELLDELRERVWAHHGPQIQQVLREQQCITANSPTSNIDDADVPP